MQKPPFLKNGDTVAIVSPSGKIQPEVISNAVNWLNSWGLEVTIGKNCLNSWHNFAGTDKDRLHDLQAALDNPEIKAIFCSRGGYGLIRIIDKLYFGEFIKYPKWIVGFSDVTFLHATVNNMIGYASLHGPMPLKFPEYPVADLSMDYLKKTLFGEKIIYSVSENKYNIKGIAQGKLVGGNLASLLSLTGSQTDFDPDEKILFLEDIDEYLYQIDRMLWALGRSHEFSRLGGLIVGNFTSLKDNEIPFGMNIQEIILQHFEKYGIPICFDFPAGHESPNYTLMMGGLTELEVGNEVRVEIIK